MITNALGGYSARTLTSALPLPLTRDNSDGRARPIGRDAIQGSADFSMQLVVGGAIDVEITAERIVDGKASARVVGVGREQKTASGPAECFNAIQVMRSHHEDKIRGTDDIRRQLPRAMFAQVDAVFERHKQRAV